MMTRSLFYLLLGACLIPLSAQAQSYLTVFGLTLGQLAPECEKKKEDIPIGCTRHLGGITISVGGPTEIPPAAGPTYGGLIDGALEQIIYTTQGGRDTATQQQIIQIVSRKYGKPTYFSKQVKQNAFGMKVVAYKAQWRLKGLYVDFDGATDIESGVLMFTTDRYYEAEDAQEREQKRNARKL